MYTNVPCLRLGDKYKHIPGEYKGVLVCLRPVHAHTIQDLFETGIETVFCEFIMATCIMYMLP